MRIGEGREMRRWKPKEEGWVEEIREDEKGEEKEKEKEERRDEDKE